MDYTKGEWKTKMSADGSRIIYSEKETGDELVCRDVRHFNMYLIAAAPDMYEALRKVRANIGHIIMTKAEAILVDEIDKALAKVEGGEQWNLHQKPTMLSP